MKVFFTISIFILIFLVNLKTGSILCYTDINQKKTEYFEYKDFPEIKYLRPCIEVWIKQLKPMKDKGEPGRCIKITYKDGQMEFIELSQGSLTLLRREKYIIYKDSIKVEVDGLNVNQPGYMLYVFENKLLNEKCTYVACLNSKYCLFSKFYYKYWHGTSLPKNIYKYFYAKEFAGCDKNYKEEYDVQGNYIKKMELAE